MLLSCPFALQVVGTTAYGVNFHTLDDDEGSAAAQEGKQLVAAVRTLFAAGSIR